MPQSPYAAGMALTGVWLKVRILLKEHLRTYLSGDEILIWVHPECVSEALLLTELEKITCPHLHSCFHVKKISFIAPLIKKKYSGQILSQRKENLASSLQKGEKIFCSATRFRICTRCVFAPGGVAVLPEPKTCMHCPWVWKELAGLHAIHTGVPTDGHVAVTLLFFRPVWGTDTFLQKQLVCYFSSCKSRPTTPEYLVHPSLPCHPRWSKFHSQV